MNRQIVANISIRLPSGETKQKQYTVYENASLLGLIRSATFNESAGTKVTKVLTCCN